MTFNTILLVKQVSDAVAHGNHLVQLGYHKTFNSFPNLLHHGSTDQLWRFGVVFVTVENHLAALQPRDEIVRQNRIQIIGKQKIGVMEQQKKKQTKVVLRIKKRSFLEEQIHTVCGVGSLVHRRTLTLLTSNQKHLIPSLLQSQARLVDPLVRNQVIDHRYDGTFHGAKVQSFLLKR